MLVEVELTKTVLVARLMFDDVLVVESELVLVLSIDIEDIEVVVALEDALFVCVWA
jgi:hypothetical protein